MTPTSEHIQILREEASRAQSRIKADGLIGHGDLLGGGALGLMRAIRSHDPKRGPLGPYVRLCIRGEIMEELRRIGQTKRVRGRHNIPHVSIQDAMDVADSHAGPGNDWRDWVRSVSPGLNRRERLVLALRYVEEFNLSEIALVVGCKQPRVSQILARTLGRLRERMTGVAA